MKTRSLDAFDPEPRVQPNLLSNRQADVVIDKLNAAVDLPLLTEKMERKIFARVVEQLNPLLRSALETCLPTDLMGSFSMLLDETKQRGEKYEQVRTVLKSRLKEPLITFLHDKIDMKFIPNKMEIQVLKKVVGMMLRQMVEQIVIGLDWCGLTGGDDAE